MNATRSRILISIVIPTLGRTAEVRACMDDLDRIAIPDLEVIVVDQNERPDPAAFGGTRCFQFRYLVSTEPNASLARNIGLSEAHGSIVLFLDDDIRILNPDFLRNHLRHYEDPLIPGVYGQVLEVDQAPTDHPTVAEIETDWGWQRLPPNYSRRCRTRNGASNNLSVRRDWAIAVGGMDAWFEKGARREETEFNLRYTKRHGPLVFDPEATLVHLSASGGSRTWGRVHGRVPMHHIVGHWYFLLRVLRDRTLGPRGVLIELRMIPIALLKNPQLGWNPLIFLINSIRAGLGLGLAFLRLLAGPRRIDSLKPNVYRELACGTDRG
jgi:GT2 family glycosyltransferase